MVKISEASEYHANEDTVNVVPLKTANVSDWAHKLRSSFGEHRFFSLGEHGFFLMLCSANRKRAFFGPIQFAKIDRPTDSFRPIQWHVVWQEKFLYISSIKKSCRHLLDAVWEAPPHTHWVSLSEWWNDDAEAIFYLFSNHFIYKNMPFYRP